jgi:POT family proton-dependent oligopeptide transporter
MIRRHLERSLPVDSTLTVSVVETRPRLPPGALLIIFFEFCERFAFYAMLSLLTLFLVGEPSGGGFGWPRSDALKLLGVFTGLMYGLPLVGGFIADRLLGHRRALILGGALLTVGYLIITFLTQLPGPALTGFVTALAALVAGNALLKSTLVVVLGDTLQGEPGRREQAYALYYMGINFGGLLAGLAAGSVAAASGWRAAFAVSAISMGVALIAFVIVSARLLGSTARPRAAAASAEAAPEAHQARRLMVLAVFAALLWVYHAGAYQVWGTMSLFIAERVDRHVGGFEIPTQWFSSVHAGALIAAAPVFAAIWTWFDKRGGEPDAVWKYVIALALGAAGLLLFAWSAWPRVDGSLTPWPIPALGILIQSAGEVAAWTSTYGLVYRLAPAQAGAATMGAFYAATLGLGAYAAGSMGPLSEAMGAGRYYLALAVVTGLAAAAALVVRRPLKAAAAAAGKPI